MNLAQLIALAAKDAIDDRPGLIGVSFSPLSISAQELERVPAEVHKLLSSKIYVAASAPQAKPRQTERVLIASDQRAAEQATAWRNLVRPADHEHLIYVSVEEHAKASGLRDCLVSVTEAQLVATLLGWIDSSDSGLPKGLGEALREAGLHETRPLSALTGFAVAARKDATKTKPWSGVAQSLPLLGLLRDSGLSSDSAALRLSANEKLVSAALSSDARRRPGKGTTTELEERLRAALRDRPASIRLQVFARMDMKEVGTPRLRAGASKPKLSSLPPPVPVTGGGGKKIPALSETKRGAAKDDAAPVRPQKQGAQQRERADRPEAQEHPREPGRRERAHRHRLHAEPLPTGLGSALSALHAGEGAPARVALKGASRSTLATSLRPEQLQVGRAPALERHCKQALARWAAARREVLALIASHVKADDVAPLLVGSFIQLCGIEDVHAALQRLLEVGEALCAEAEGAPSAARLETLRLDTIEIHDGSRLVLRLFGPLHTLALGQALARAERSAAADALSGSARRLARHAVAAPPIAPQVLPEGAEGELFLARPEHGLIVFERAPDAVVGEPVALLALALVRRYTELSPHSLLGLRIALVDGDEAGFVRGIERALEALPELRRVELLSRRPPRLEDHHDLLASGRLTVDGLPLDDTGLADAAPHVVVRFVSDESLPRDREPALPRTTAAATAGAASTFERLANALRVSTPLQDRGSIAFERLHAAVRERKPLGAFVTEHAALALRSVAPAHALTAVTWHAIIAPSLGRRPPLGYSLIVHDQVDSAQCAVLSQELRPVTRGLQQGLARLGVRESRPSILKGLASTLSSFTSSPLSSLWRRSELQLLAGLLALELTRQSEAERLIVPVSPETLQALLDVPASDYTNEVLMLALVVREGKLVPTLGVATADSQADVDLTGNTLSGKVGALTEALATTWRLAARGTGPDGAAAQELLSWLIWPTLAAEDRVPEGLEAALRARSLEAAPPDLVLLAPPAITGALPRSKKSRVSVRSLDPSQLNALMLR